MNNNLLILGAGQFGAVVKEIAESTGCFDSIEFLDDSFGTSDADESYHERSIGNLAKYDDLAANFSYAIVSIGNPKIRMGWTKRLIERGYTIPAIISPRSYVSPSAQLTKGVVIAPMSVVNANAHVGEGTFVVSGTIVDHNAFVGNYCNLQCGTVVMPAAVVPNFTMSQPNDVIRRAPMIFTHENCKGKEMPITTDGNVEG